MEPQGEQAQHDLRDWDGSPSVDDLPEIPWQYPKRDRTPGEKLIFLAMVKAMRLVQAVAKTGYNEQQKYRFRGIDGVLDAVGPALREAGIFVTSEILSLEYRDTMTTGRDPRPTREVTARIRYTFHAEDGSSISTEVAGESLDQSDKGTAKAFSVALRIALLQTLALPTNEPTTDDNGQYHTRAAQSLSAWERRTGRALVEHGDVAGMVEFWDAVVAAGSTEAPVADPDGPSWLEVYAQAFLKASEALRDVPAAKALWDQLKPLGALSWTVERNGTHPQLGNVIRDRVSALQEKVHGHLVKMITTAETMDQWEDAIAHVKADTADAELPQDQIDHLRALAMERKAKLADGVEPAVVTDPAGLTEEQFLPPVGQAWEEFVARATQENLDQGKILALLYGGPDGSDVLAAYEWGRDGIVRVQDAIKAAQHRDGTITAAQADALHERLDKVANDHGISWSQS